MRCKKEEFVKDQYFHFYNHAIGDELKIGDIQIFWSGLEQETENYLMTNF